MSQATAQPILIVGVNGQLGRDLSLVCQQRNLSYLGAQRNPQAHHIAVDFSDEVNFFSLLRQYRPRCVLNCAAYTAVDAAENESQIARQTNTIAAGDLAKACKALDIPLIHFSTDYVFSGDQSRPYREDDICRPLNVYGQTKLEGEQRIRDQGGVHYIFRCSWLYRPGHTNFVSTMLRLFARSQSLRVVDDQWGCPTWTRPLAEAVIDFVQQGLLDPQHFVTNSGTYHLCADGEANWFAFAQAIASLSETSPITQPQAISSLEYPTQAHRPKYSVLDCQHAESILGLRLSHWRQQLDEAMPLFNAHTLQAKG